MPIFAAEYEGVLAESFRDVGAVEAGVQYDAEG